VQESINLSAKISKSVHFKPSVNVQINNFLTLHNLLTLIFESMCFNLLTQKTDLTIKIAFKYVFLYKHFTPSTNKNETNKASVDIRRTNNKFQWLRVTRSCKDISEEEKNLT